MADIRYGEVLFESEDGEFTVYEAPAVTPGSVWLRVDASWHLLSPQQAVELGVALNNHSYPYTTGR